MANLKPFLNNIGQWIVATIVFGYICLIRFTCTFKIENSHHIRTAQQVGSCSQQTGGCVVAVWHGRLLLMPWLFPHKSQVLALISAHRDGQLISKVASLFTIGTIVGSTSKGAIKALKQMVSLSRDGATIFITPDGPKGPRMHAQAGAVEVARMAGVPLLAVSISASKGKLFNSWDKFMLPYPFSTISIIWAEPMLIAKDADKQTKKQAVLELQATMSQLQNQADSEVNLSFIKTKVN